MLYSVCFTGLTVPPYHQLQQWLIQASHCNSLCCYKTSARHEGVDPDGFGLRLTSQCKTSGLIGLSFGVTSKISSSSIRINIQIELVPVWIFLSFSLTTFASNDWPVHLLFAHQSNIGVLECPRCEDGWPSSSPAYKALRLNI